MRFGVFPSYFESFCYALHEVYLARIPVIVSNRPGTKDFFRHEENALLFDGSVDDLTRQMERLAGNADLRHRLACPYPVATDPLGSFYDGPQAESWIRTETPQRPSLLVCVIEEKGEARPPALEALAAGQLQDMRMVRLRPANDGVDLAAAWLLGGLYTLHAGDGSPLLPTEVCTGQACWSCAAATCPAQTTWRVASTRSRGSRKLPSSAVGNASSTASRSPYGTSSRWTPPWKWPRSAAARR